MKWLRFLFHSLVMTIHAGVVVLFLLSAFSDRISPETSTLFAYLGLGFPLLFAELMLYLLLVVYARMEIHLGGLACIPFYVGTDKTLFSSSFAHD